VQLARYQLADWLVGPCNNRKIKEKERENIFVNFYLNFILTFRKINKLFKIDNKSNNLEAVVRDTRISSSSLLLLLQ
jgi:iron only hydrogenase large subunit-like protein